VPNFREQIPRSVIAVAIAVIAAVPGACGGDVGGDLGSPCEDHGDCQSNTQCLASVCTGLCESDGDCGGGYACTERGRCEASGAAAGVPCRREADCGPGLACGLQATDSDADGRLDGACTVELPGRPLGDTCADDRDCRSGLCALARCTVVCADDGDCAANHACVDVPSVGSQGALYQSCLPAEGRATVSWSLDGPSGAVVIPVPSHAVSLALTSAVADPAQVVGPTSVRAPNGDVLYDRDRPTAGNALRFEPSRGASTLLLPNTPALRLRTGLYRVDVASAVRGGPGTAAPTVRVDYLLGRGGSRLDLNVHVVSLESHPCADQLGFASAAEAAAAEALRDQFLPEVERIFAAADIELGSVQFIELDVAAELAVLDATEIDDLLVAGGSDDAVDLFLVRGIRPAGLQAVGGGTRRAPRLANAPVSGVALSAETLCYRSWTETARVAAHAIARQLGLFRSIEPDGTEDLIGDSEADSNNLLYFGEYGGIELSAGQASVLRANPVLQ